MCLGTTPGLRHNQMFCKQAETQQGAQRKQSNDWKNFIHPAVFFIVHSKRNLLLWVLSKELATRCGWLLFAVYGGGSSLTNIWEVSSLKGVEVFKETLPTDFPAFSRGNCKVWGGGEWDKGGCDVWTKIIIIIIVVVIIVIIIVITRFSLGIIIFVRPDYKHFMLELRTSVVC